MDDDVVELPNMNENVFMFTLFYIIFCYCFVFKSNEFMSAGVTVESLFGSLIGSESENFVLYHIRRSTQTLCIHSILPLGWYVGLVTIAGHPLMEEEFGMLSIILTLSFYLLISAGIHLYLWRKDNWGGHPIALKIALLCGNAGRMSWRTLASEINVEFRRVNKLSIKCGSLAKVVVTDNWIMKVTPYNMDLALHNQAFLSVESASTHALSAPDTGSPQFLNIKVSYPVMNLPIQHFWIRINAVDFKDLQDKVQRPIHVPQNIVILKTRTEQFVEVFREQVFQNPSYRTAEEMENCIGCMVNLANCKLFKNCQDDEGINPCMRCYCRPMWCISCMATWFASRQDQDHPETWLGSKCTCPVCRSVFCVLDVCPTEQVEQDQLNN